MTAVQEQAHERVAARQRLCRAIKEVLIERLELTIDPDWITDDQPIFGRGMQLDSLQAIEVVVGLEWRFKVSLADDQTSSFASVNMLADLIEQNGTV
jgi:acyl carrier protein